MFGLFCSHAAYKSYQTTSFYNLETELKSKFCVDLIFILLNCKNKMNKKTLRTIKLTKIIFNI